MITLSGVTKTFDGKRTVTALENVSLAIERGEMVSIVGASGSGKSTLLNLVGALDHPTSGWIEVDGQRLDGLSDDELTKVRRDKVGFIFQFFNLLPTLNCLENVALPLHLRGLGAEEGRRTGHASCSISSSLANASSTCRTSCRAASGSAWRSPARSPSTRPSCWPTSRPAISTRRPARTSSRSSRDLHQRLKATVLIVTHDRQVADSCARTITLRDGRIVGDERR